MEFVDIAGLVKGASKGEGLGNKFLGNIRECDAIVHVVRCFEGTDIVHVEGNVDPVRDIETIDTELILSDLEVVSNRAARMAKAGKTGDKKALASAAWLSALEEHLRGQKCAHLPAGRGRRGQVLQMREMGLLTAKPVIYAANMSEDDLMEGMLGNPHYQTVKKLALDEGAECIPICAKTEEDIADYTPEEKKEFLAEMGIEATGLDNLIKASYGLLGLISFLTDGKKECRAWTIRRGTKALRPQGRSIPILSAASSAPAW